MRSWAPSGCFCRKIGLRELSLVVEDAGEGAVTGSEITWLILCTSHFYELIRLLLPGSFLTLFTSSLTVLYST